MIGAILFAAACAHVQRPVWTTPIAPLEEPAQVTVPEPTVDECPGGALVPGRPAPCVDARGLAVLRATVVPERLIYQWRNAELGLPAWREQAESCQRLRAADRAWAETRILDLEADVKALEREARYRRWGGPVLLIGGFVVGAGAAAAMVEVVVNAD